MCPHCANSYRLTSSSKQTQRLLQLQYNSTHSHNSCKPTLWHTSDTVGQQITGTQPQLSTSLFQVHHHPYLHHLTRESILSLVGDSSHHFSLRDRNTRWPHEQTPRVDTLISIYHHLFTSTAHLICRAPRTQHIDDEGGMSGVWSLRPRLLALGMFPAITQPQEEFSDTLGTDDTTYKKRGHSLSLRC